MKTVDVLLTGQVMQGVDVQTCAASLARLAGIDQRTALLMLSAGRLIRIKRGVEASAGLQYFRALSAIGAAVQLRPAGDKAAGLELSSVVQVAPGMAAGPSGVSRQQPAAAAPRRTGPRTAAQPRLGPGPPIPPSCPASRTTALQELRSSPSVANRGFAAFFLHRGTRRVALALPNGPKSRRSDDWLATPRQVPAGQGWEWLCQAWGQFTEQSGLWLLCFSLCCAALGLIFWLPAVHIFVMVIVLPVLLGILMLVAHRQHLEEPLGSLRPLAAALQRGQRLLLLGLLSLLFLLSLGTGYFLAADAGLVGTNLFALPGLQKPGPAQMQNMVVGAVLLLFSMLALAGYLFAIPLVLFVRLRPLQGFQLGVYGCITNWRAMLTALTIAASGLSTTLVLVHVLQQFCPWLPGIVYAGFITVAIVLTPIIGVLFVYYAFRDMFAIIP